MLWIYLQLIETEEDKQLFELLYEAHRKQMIYVANRVLRSDSLSEDAVHNAFLGIANNMKALHGRSPEDQKNYLLKAAKYAAWNLTKREKKQDDYFVSWEAEPTEDLILEEMSAKLDQEAVVRVILGMREPYSTVLYYHFLMEMGDKEIAAVLQKKDTAVRKQISRGKELLKKALEEVLPVYG